MQSRLRNILATMHLLIIVLWMGANSLFIHHHTINGVKISHSHPYTGDATNHNHSLDNFAHLSRTSDGEMLGGDDVAYCEHLEGIKLYDYGELLSEIFDPSIDAISQRGPPLLA